MLLGLRLEFFILRNQFYTKSMAERSNVTVIIWRVEEIPHRYALITNRTRRYKSGYGAANPSELFQMQEVVPGIEFNHMFDALGAALGMNPDTLEVFSRRSRQ